ncbi:hypothetical protein [Corallococcus terminator]|uniref:Uncharacterized protein n=1 Tax=Corallococcus terminator TaxID=2316733 RepID=A0A3A8IAA7_9BACT|nr:hypothetical protein [Corallococcus terminator]RKG80409.1 hypothetical protein D7V88_27530 [Corallococcus terminator]
MKTERMISGRGLALVLTTFALALTGTGCADECVDDFDCRDEGAPPEGQRYACVEERCELTPITVPDAGTETDAGTSTDAGTGTDAGTTVDAGTDAGTAVDAGTDAGTETDAGTSTDAGTETDAGTDAGTETDAGTDAGPSDPCLSATYDPKLGTLQLAADFVAGESAALPATAGPVGVTPGPTYSLFTVVSGGSSGPHALYSLGTWPQVSLGAAPLYDVAAPGDRAPSAVLFLNGFVESDGQRVLTGYTKSGTGFPGTLAVYDTVTPASSSYVPAPSNFTAGVVPGAFLINGGGLDTVSAGLAIYALRTDTTPFTSLKVGTLPSVTGGSGFTAVATNGVAMLGYFSDDTFTNVGHAVAPAKIEAAIRSGTPFVVADEPVLDVGSNFVAAAGQGEGVAVLRGDYVPPNYNFAGTDVSRFAFTVTNEGGAVTVGSRQPVLTYVNQCTRVTGMTAIGTDLLVSLDDKNGPRLVRIGQVQ